MNETHEEWLDRMRSIGSISRYKPGATKKDVEKAIEGHVLAEGQLMGTYQRR